VRAAVLRELGDVLVEAVELDPPSAGDVLVRVPFLVRRQAQPVRGRRQERCPRDADGRARRLELPDPPGLVHPDHPPERIR
jgi:hypothetical protein